MSLNIKIYTTVKGKDWDVEALRSIQGVDDIGTYKVLKNIPSGGNTERAHFSGYATPPKNEYDKLHQHLLHLNNHHFALRDAGVKEIILYLTYLSDSILINTEIEPEDIELLHRTGAALALTTDAPTYMRAPDDTPDKYRHLKR